MNHLNYQIIAKFLSYYAYSLTNQPAIDLILCNGRNPLFYIMYYYYFIYSIVNIYSVILCKYMYY